MSGSTIFCKIASLVLRIFLSRVAGAETLGIYMMILPIIGLLINFTQAGVPSALFTLSANPKYDSRKLLISSAILCFFQTIVCFIFVLIFNRFFSTIRPYLSNILIFIAFASLSALLRSYHLGKQQVHIPAISQVIEEVVRMAALYFIYLKTNTLTLENALLGMLLGEMSACLFMVIFFKVKTKLPSLSIFKDSLLYKEILSISIPVSCTQLVHGVCRFLEPLFYRFFLSQSGYSEKAINTTYGILNGCVFSLLMVPTFLNSVIYRIILPKITQTLNNKKRTQTLLIKSTICCVLIGLPFSIVFFFFPKVSLSLLFGSSDGFAYLKYLAFPFLVFYLQTPLQAYLQASRKQKILLTISFCQSIVSLALLVIFLPSLGPSALAFSYLCGLLTSSLLSFLYVYHHLFLQKE